MIISKFDEKNPNTKTSLLQRSEMIKDYVYQFVVSILSPFSSSYMPFELQYAASVIRKYANRQKLDPPPLISSIILLRLINPAIMLPEIKLHTNKPTTKQRRTLMLISKILQVFVIIQPYFLKCLFVT